jgi:hypothetical protein
MDVREKPSKYVLHGNTVGYLKLEASLGELNLAVSSVVVGQ